jgi:hypothetical protein
VELLAYVGWQRLYLPVVCVDVVNENLVFLAKKRDCRDYFLGCDRGQVFYVCKYIVLQLHPWEVALVDRPQEQVTFYIKNLSLESTYVFVETRLDLFVVIYLFLVLFIDYFLVLKISQNF